MDDITRSGAEDRLGLRDRAAMRTAHAVTGVFLALGLLGALRTGLQATESLTVFTVSPATAAAWLAIGAVGAGMVTDRHRARARRYLLVVGPLLIAWAALAVVVGGAGGATFTRDAETVALHAVAGILAVAVGLVPARGTAATPPTNSPSDDAPANTP